MRSVEKIETATEPRFQELFVAAMAFPHGNAPTRTSSSLVDAARPPGPRSGRAPATPTTDERHDRVMTDAETTAPAARRGGGRRRAPRPAPPTAGRRS